MTPIKVKRQECLIYSRPCGWLTPTSRWNKGKISEFKDREEYDIDEESI
jgi:anaerobic ribonucleoside-triphosphate reductase